MLYISIVLILIGYILGSIPFGLIIGKVFYNTDIREHGSHNIGMTNAYRILGPVAGISVLLADIFKGLIPVLLAKDTLSFKGIVPELILRHAFTPRPDLIPIVAVLAGVAAILGHCYSIFLKFSGGKGMSTAGGLVFALWPKVGIILILIWIILLVVTRYSSVSSMTLAVLLPVLVSILYPKTEYIVFSILVAIVLIYMHRSNIARLIAGKELRLGEKANLEED